MNEAPAVVVDRIAESYDETPYPSLAVPAQTRHRRPYRCGAPFISFRQILPPHRPANLRGVNERPVAW